MLNIYRVLHSSNFAYVMSQNPPHTREQLTISPNILWMGKRTSKRLCALFEVTLAKARLAQAMSFVTPALPESRALPSASHSARRFPDQRSVHVLVMLPPLEGTGGAVPPGISDTAP